jgi:hypothetical protein
LAWSGKIVKGWSNLLQIKRVEAFSEPPVDRSEKLAGLIPLLLFTPKARQRNGRVLLRAFGGLRRGNIDSHSQACLRSVDLAECLEYPRADRMNSRQTPAVSNVSSTLG